ncbi:WhiB family transcriptional regulator [Streptomyces albus]|uniref:Transcriptional regulator WhiB n=1 Tax=Streptomyces albus TaxID=1888 RepID=A0A8H1L8K8_9ACTN|nr:WhiB family transcriptional regulator [Streptomyces albus]TGG78446.1 WhiB family transcriptional regulator [Streptomyces albus]UVN59479.1 WhiB family transcriptional regulator [Streptomyces albus]
MNIVRTYTRRQVSTATEAPVRPRPACADEDPELFFPTGNDPAALEQFAEAKAVCARCPLTARCLQTALERNEAGVWGGTDEQTRRLIKIRALHGAAA